MIRGTIIDNIPYTTLPVGEPVVPGEHHEGGGDQAQDPVLPLHTTAPGQVNHDDVTTKLCHFICL